MIFESGSSLPVAYRRGDNGAISEVILLHVPAQKVEIARKGLEAENMAVGTDQNARQ